MASCQPFFLPVRAWSYFIHHHQSTLILFSFHVSSADHAATPPLQLQDTTLDTNQIPPPPRVLECRSHVAPWHRRFLTAARVNHLHFFHLSCPCQTLLGVCHNRPLPVRLPHARYFGAQHLAVGKRSPKWLERETLWLYTSVSGPAQTGSSLAPTSPDRFIVA